MNRKDARAVVYCLDFATNYIDRDTPELNRARKVADQLAKKHKIKKRKGINDGSMVY